MHHRLLGPLVEPGTFARSVSGAIGQDARGKDDASGKVKVL